MTKTETAVPRYLLCSTLIGCTTLDDILIALPLCARCALYYNAILPKGPAARPCWIPPAWRISGIEPSCTSETYRRFITRRTWRYALSTCTEPCTNVWPFDYHLREPSSSPKNPMTNFISVGLRPGLCSHGPAPGFRPWSRAKGLPGLCAILANVPPLDSGP